MEQPNQVPAGDDQIVWQSICVTEPGYKALLRLQSSLLRLAARARAAVSKRAEMVATDPDRYEDEIEAMTTEDLQRVAGIIDTAAQRVSRQIHLGDG